MSLCRFPWCVLPSSYQGLFHALNDQKWHHHIISDSILSDTNQIFDRLNQVLRRDLLPNSSGSTKKEIKGVRKLCFSFWVFLGE